MSTWTSVQPRCRVPSHSLLSVTQLVSLKAHGERVGHRVIAWPHQISPNWVRCLAQVKTSNLKGIKCKFDGHMPTSNTIAPILPHSPSCPLTYTQRNHSRGSHSGGALRWQWVSVSLTTCKTFQSLFNIYIKEDLQQNICNLIIFVYQNRFSSWPSTRNMKINEGDTYKGYPRVHEGGGERERKKWQGNTSAALHKHYTMCPR